MNFVFYDFETSGKDKDFDQILQIGAVLVDEGLQVKDKFNIKIDCDLNRKINLTKYKNMECIAILFKT